MQIKSITQEIQDVILTYFFDDSEEPKYENLHGSSLILELIEPKSSDSGEKVFKFYLCNEDIIRKTLQQSKIPSLWRSMKNRVISGIPELNDDNCSYEKLVERAMQLLPKLVESEININFSASGLIYQAWKEAKFIDLKNKKNRDDIIDGLFLTHNTIKEYLKKNASRLTELRNQASPKILLLAMAEALGVRISERQEDQKPKRYFFSDGNEWKLSYEEISKPELEFLEFGLIHRVNPQEILDIEKEQLEHCEKEQYEGKHLYLVSYPIILDDYWFLGFAWFFQVGNPRKVEAEAYKKEKYEKLWRVVNTVGKSIKLGLRDEILVQGLEESINTNKLFKLSFDELFYKVAHKYFSCLQVLKSSDALISDSNLDGWHLLQTYRSINFYIPQQIWNSSNNSCAELLKQELESLEEFLQKAYTIGANKEKKRYFTSVAHEIKKLVPIIGNDDVAQPLRALIREYFMTVFSTMSSDPDEISNQDMNDFPDEFAKGENIYEFIENQLYLSTKLNILIEKCLSGNIYFTKQDINEIFHEGVKQECKKLLVADEKLRNKKLPQNSKKYFFASALIAAINNIFKNKDESSPIEFSVYKETLYIRNKRKNNALLQKREGGTRQVLELYLEKYMPDTDPKSIIFQADNKDENYWITGLPCI